MNETSKDIAVQKLSAAPLGERGIVLRNLDDLWRFSNMVIKAKLAPPTIVTTEQACVVIQCGLELGLSPMAALQNMYVVNQKPTLYGEVGIGLCWASGKMEEFQQWYTGTYPTDDFTAHCKTKRKGVDAWKEREFSIADAKRAGLWEQKTSTGKPSNWMLYPKDQLMWKATWRCLRSSYADVLKGVQGHEDVDVIEAQYEVIPPTDRRNRSDEIAERLERAQTERPVPAEETPVPDLLETVETK